MQPIYRNMTIIFRSKIEICGSVSTKDAVEKATACKYSSRSMSKEKKKSSLIDDPTSCRCRRRLGTYGSHFAGFLLCYHFPHCHNMTHVANILYLENHIIRFI